MFLGEKVAQCFQTFIPLSLGKSLFFTYLGSSLGIYNKDVNSNRASRVSLFAHHYIPHSKPNDDSRCFKIFLSQGRHTLEKSVGGLKKTEIFRRPFQGERTPKRWKALFFPWIQTEEREKGGGRKGEEGRERGDRGGGRA